MASSISRNKKYSAIKSCIVYMNGDLFSSDKNICLAHCISADAKLGKGVAKIFRSKYQGIDEILAQGKKPGECAVLKRDDRFIYNLVTKQLYHQKPTYMTIENALRDMSKHCVANNVKSIAMPKIGCGLDKLDWKKVSDIIDQVFDKTDIKITVYVL